MADLKISQLTGASTPLAGTEVLPIVQSGSTVKVSVANLTAGRAVGMAGGSFTDNITQSTAAKGVNFTANTPAAGMTSQLLNWYEEGTWTPTFTSSGGAFSSVTYNSITGGRYTRVGKIVHIQAAIATDAITIGSVSGNVWIEGLPFAAVANTGSTNNGFSAMSIGYSSNFAASTPTHGYITANQQRIELYTRTTADGASSALNITNLSTTDKNYIYFSAAYICA